LGVAELVLARFAPQRTLDRTLRDQPPMYRPHDVRVRDLVPGFEGRLVEREFDTAVRINSLGYRQPEFSAEKNGEVRILAVGDSFTFGYGVEEHESFVATMAAELVRCGVRSAQVVNAGVPGRWLDSYYLELKTRVLDLNPDVVLVGLFHGNDLASPDSEAYEWVEVDAAGLPVRLRSPEAMIEDGRPVARKRKLRWRLPVLRNSHVVQLLFDSGNGIHRWFWPYVRSFDMYEKEYTPDTLATLERAERLLVAMARLARERGARFGVIEIPAREQIYQPAHLLLEDLDFDKSQLVLGEILARNGIESIDLLPTLGAASEGPRLYFRTDSHMTRAGHALAGPTIAREALRRGWIPGREAAPPAPDCPARLAE
jgi:hypothetical protein